MEEDHGSQVKHALLLTCLGAFGTTLGGIIATVAPNIDFKHLGILQGFAAGLMMALSFFDLMPAVMETVGKGGAYMCFFLGVLFIALVVAVIPEPGQFVTVQEDGDNKGDSSPHAKHSRRQVLTAGLITALGIALHNYPEGVAVYLASLKSRKVGVNIAVAIAMHNIPEGIAVALPVYFATRSRFQGLKYAILSGLPEPLAVLIQAVFQQQMSAHALEQLLAGVAGIMAFISFHELLPLAIQHAGAKPSVRALFVGMAIMAGNLYVMARYFDI